MIIDAEAVRQSQLRHVWHLVCEWTALEFVGPPGMLSGDTAVGNPGGHYRLLRHIASQFRDALIIEMGVFLRGGGGVLWEGGGYVQRRASARVHAGLFVHASMRMHAASMITEGVCVCVRVCPRVYVRVSGTMHGGSAIALASGSKTNSVVTYNIVDDFSPNAAACGMTGLYFTTSPCSLLRLFPLYYYLIFTSPRSSRLLPECCCVWSVYS